MSDDDDAEEDFLLSIVKKIISTRAALIRNGSDDQCLTLFLHSGVQREFRTLFQLLSECEVSSISEELKSLKQFNPDYIRYSNQLKIVKHLIKTGAKINAKVKSGDLKGLTPLHLTVKQNDEEMTKLLIKHGADINVQDSNKMTPLDFSVKLNNLNMAKLLITELTKQSVTDAADSKETRPNLSSNIINKKTSLYLAVQSQVFAVDFVQLLLENGADVNEVDDDGNTVLHYLLNPMNPFLTGTMSSRLPEVMDILIHHQVNVNVNNSLNQTPIHLLLTNFSKYQDMLSWMSRTGAILHERDSNGHVLLKCSNLNMSLTEEDEKWTLLIKSGYNLFAKNSNEQTLLHYAAEVGLPSVVDYCISWDIQTNYLSTPETSSILLNRKTSILFTKDNLGHTPLQNFHPSCAACITRKILDDLKDYGLMNEIMLFHKVCRQNEPNLIIRMFRTGKVDLLQSDESGNIPCSYLNGRGFQRLFRDIRNATVFLVLSSVAIPRLGSASPFSCMPHELIQMLVSCLKFA